jgi:RNA polymerase sigma-32 factor
MDEEEIEQDEQEEISEEEGEPSERGIAVFDPLRRYLMEIRKYPLLSKEEEHRLAVLSKVLDCEDGEDPLQAITTLVLSHLRLAASIAMEYKHLPFDTMDLIQEGNVGLMQAIKKFDPFREIRVATYATWWIRAYILKYIIQNWRLVRIGTTEVQRKLFFNLSKERDRLEKLGFTVGTKLLADHFHVKEKEVIDVEQRLSWGQEVSIDEPIHDGGEEGSDNGLLHQIASQEIGMAQQLEEDQLKTLFQSKLKAFYKTLNTRDAEILSNRILSDAPITLDTLGIQYGISKERVRQLEENIVKKLRKFIKQEIKDSDEIFS